MCVRKQTTDRIIRKTKNYIFAFRSAVDTSQGAGQDAFGHFRKKFLNGLEPSPRSNVPTAKPLTKNKRRVNGITFVTGNGKDKKTAREDKGSNGDPAAREPAGSMADEGQGMGARELQPLTHVCYVCPRNFRNNNGTTPVARGSRHVIKSRTYAYHMACELMANKASSS